MVQADVLKGISTSRPDTMHPTSHPLSALPMSRSVQKAQQESDRRKHASADRSTRTMVCLLSSKIIYSALDCACL